MLRIQPSDRPLLGDLAQLERPFEVGQSAAHDAHPAQTQRGAPQGGAGGDRRAAGRRQQAVTGGLDAADAVRVDLVDVLRRAKD